MMLKKLESDVIRSVFLVRKISTFGAIVHMKIRPIFALVLFSLFAGITAAQTPTPENAAVRVPLENYLKGHATGDGEYMKKAFHTEGNLVFIRDGKFTMRSFADYIAGFTGKPPADEDKRKRWIESVDIAGNAAFAKIILDYPTVKFVDYMSLLKINGEWKIVNKSFHAEPKNEAEAPKKQ